MIHVKSLLAAVTIIATCFACTMPPPDAQIPTNAQTPLPDPAVARFNGVYQFVSAKLVAESTMTVSQRMRSCSQSPIEGPLTIVNGQATYSYSSREHHFEGTVGRGGQLRITRGGLTPTDFITQGAIDADSGTIRARQMGNRCTYDLIWQKAPR